MMGPEWRGQGSLTARREVVLDLRLEAVILGLKLAGAVLDLELEEEEVPDQTLEQEARVLLRMRAEVEGQTPRTRTAEQRPARSGFHSVGHGPMDRGLEVAAWQVVRPEASE